jgi:hypothetical protein
MSMEILPSPSPEQLAEEARRILAEHPMTPRELFEFLVEKGIIDRNGRVLCNRLFGGADDEQTDGTSSSGSTNGQAEQPAQPQTGQDSPSLPSS